MPCLNKFLEGDYTPPAEAMGLISDTKQAIQDSPKGIFNWYLFLCTCIFALSGIPKGFDEGKMNRRHVLTKFSLQAGNIASIVVQSHFKEVFGLNLESEAQYANTKGWLVSIATAGAVFGCLGVCVLSNSPQHVLTRRSVYPL